MSKQLNIVGIGASAGGLDAIQQLFDHLPANTGMAFVIVQHLSPDFKSLMAELLAKHTKMKIYTAEDKMSVKPNCVYLNPRNKNLHIKGDKLYLLDKGPKRNLNLPIDIFFHTLGEEKKHESIGVILSGTGSDGSRGIKTIKEGGGTIIVQEPDTAQFDGMPNTAISTNLVDFILTPEKIADVLSKFQGSLPELSTSDVDDSSGLGVYNKVLEEVLRVSGIDFRSYKPSTMLRRLEKRMAFSNIKTLDAYYHHIRTNQSECEALQQDFLIGVTSFFRDTRAFESLEENVVPNLFKSRPANKPVRVWISGCSTGEEVYSMAILLEQYREENKILCDFKIFATDVDSQALQVASLGVYNVNSVLDLFKTEYRRYFSQGDEKLQIVKKIRDKVVFSNHNLLKDPPFIRMDLISCRNLLIYLNNTEQQKVFHNFQFALNKYAYLFLGSSESLGDAGKLFKTLDVKWKIYQSIADKKYVPSRKEGANDSLSVTHRSFANKYGNKSNGSQTSPEKLFLKFIAEKFGPDCIFFDSDYNVLYINGEAGKKLTFNEGLFQSNLLKMVSPEIASLIRNSVNRMVANKSDIVVKDVDNTENGNSKVFDLTFTKMDAEVKDDVVFVMQFGFDKKIDAELISAKNFTIDEANKQLVEDLEKELKSSKIDLQNVVEELETSNEELQSSNEELMASNEELQSTNEELQSVNEELFTVNTELQEKNRELSRVSNDMMNLMHSTEIGTLFLDLDLKIRDFTPSLQKHFHLQDSDRGREIVSFNSNFDEKTRASIIEDSSKALESLKTIEGEIIDKDGTSFLKRVGPFITADRKIDGVVITFVDVTQLKKKEAELSLVENKYQQLFENLNEGFAHAKIITNKKGEPIDWEYISINPTFEKLIGQNAENVVGHKVSEVLPEVLNDPADWVSKYGHTALTGEQQLIQNYSKPLGRFLVVHVFSPAKGEFAATFSDLSEMKRNEMALKESNQKFELAANITGLALWEWNLQDNSVVGNDKWKEYFGLSGEDVLTEWAQNMDPEEAKVSNAKAEKYLKGEIDEYIDTYRYFHPKSESVSWLKSVGRIVERDEDGNPIKMLGVTIDVTEEKIAEIKLVAATNKAEAANIHKNHFLANVGHEIRTPMNGVVGFSGLLKDENLSPQLRDKYLEIIDSNSKQLLNLIDDIIDIAKIESKEMRIHLGECNIRSLVEDLKITYEQLKIERDREDVGLVLDIPKKLDFSFIRSDDKRLKQILINLLNNALKFTEHGKITFGFKIEKDFLRFFVKDEGIGIPKDKLQEIFERFKQVDYQSAKYGGTGLGLAISKGLTELLGGLFDVKSTFGNGSTFSFTIPFEVVEIDETKIASKKYNGSFLKGKTILAVDDTEMNLILIQAVLKDYDVKIITAEDGEVAIEKFKKAKGTIDAVLMDIRMPKVDGYQAMVEILNIEPSAVVIMQSAHAMQEEKNKCLELGGKGYLTKPINRNLLIETLDQFI